MEDMDGYKFFLDAPNNGNGAESWVLLRGSGTEPLLRIYCEASSPELVDEILSAAEVVRLSQGNCGVTPVAASDAGAPCSPASGSPVRPARWSDWANVWSLFSTRARSSMIELSRESHVVCSIIFGRFARCAAL